MECQLKARPSRSCQTCEMWNHDRNMQDIKFRSCAFTGGHKVSNHISILKEGVDIAVCTPGRLTQLRNANHIRLDYCKVCLLDVDASLLAR